MVLQSTTRLEVRVTYCPTLRPQIRLAEPIDPAELVATSRQPEQAAERRQHISMRPRRFARLDSHADP